MPRPLTFGVEYEFAFATVPVDFKPPKSEKTDGLPRALRCNASSRNAARLYQEAFAAINNVLHNNGYGLPTILDAPERGTTSIGLRSLDNTRWHLEKDPTIRGPNRDYHWLQIELISPILKCDMRGGGDAMIVANLIEENFRVSVNTSTGMHVHIGDGNLGFPLAVCHRIMGFFYVFDEQLKYLHPPSRRFNDYARNIRESCMLNISNSWSVEESLEAIMATKTIEDLEFGFGGRRPAVNLKNLRRGANPNKKTIEFRQHAMTFDIQRIEAWIQTVEAVVEWCRNATGDEYNELVCESAQGQDSNQSLSYPTAVDVIRAISLGSGVNFHAKYPVRFYKGRLAETKGEEPETAEVIDPQPLSEQYVLDSSDSSDDAGSSDRGETSDVDMD